MKTPLFALGIVLGLIAASAAAETTQLGPFALRVDEPVITLDYRGGRLLRIDDEPTLSIFADGRVVMPQSYAHTQAYEGRIEPNEVLELLNFIVLDSRFFEYDEDAVRSKLAELSTPARRLPVHLSTTVIRVTANSQTKEVSSFALGKGPMIEETERIQAVRERLDQVMWIVKLGGQGELDRLLAAVNRRLREEYPDAKPFSASELERASVQPDGTRNARFVHRYAPADAPSSATVTEPAAGASRVSLFGEVGSETGE